jgi:Rieske Fe-S protein
MSADDKYPESSGRRRFVKGVVGSASLVGLGSVGTVAVDTLTSPSGTGGGTTEFYGIENTAGPAPRSMPQLVIDVDEEGFIRGRYPTVETVEQKGEEVQIAEEEIGDITYSANWFQYCGVQGYQGISPSYEGDNYFRYATDPPFDWQSSEVSAGDRVNVDDFEDYETWGNDIGRSGIGKPASVVWRSQETENTIPCQLIRSTRVERLLEENPDDAWLQESMEQGFVGWLNKCTHFCCVPGFKSTSQAEKFNAEDDVYCPCHQSVYDPYSIVRSAFVAYPRPEDG